MMRTEFFTDFVSEVEELNKAFLNAQIHGEYQKLATIMEEIVYFNREIDFMISLDNSIIDRLPISERGEFIERAKHLSSVCTSTTYYPTHLLAA